MSSEPAGGDPKVVVRVEGRVGRLTLNRPRAINALDHEMVGILREALDAWARDPDIDAVMLDGAGERGLCAGGDIVSIYRDAREGGTGSLRFWADEYALNALIARYPKPYVALMDGIVMGGGIGVSAHGGVRVVTERSRLAMPETGIGFIPDIGGTHLLSRAPGQLGTHLGLTGTSMSAGDAIAAGFADHFVPSDRLDRFREAVVVDGVDAALDALAEEPPASELLAQRAWIDEAYDHDTVEAVLEHLARMDAPEAAEAADVLGTRSPTALKVTLRSVRDAHTSPDLETTLNREYRVSAASLRGHDLGEGIRAQVIDKDRAPQWEPATLATVSAAMVESFFAPAEPELDLRAPADSARPTEPARPTESTRE